MEKRNTTFFTIVHFTGDSSLTYEEIKKSHLDSGESEIGFHYIIDSQGKILMGRHASKIGAHYPEFDETSLGICVIGARHDLQEHQSVALTLLLENLKNDFPEIQKVKYIYKEKENE
ncbi:MAG: hypothetical protein F3744_05685 [Nitrospinae bacterium]|nr:hypothetical protein [Nitrospinota bacterium]